MDADTIIHRLEGAIAPKSLSSLERCILQGSWEEMGYEVIAERYGYGAGHVRDTGARLWQDLSPLVGQRVTKKNLRGVLNYWINQAVGPATQVSGITHWGETVDLGNFYGREAEQEELYRWIQRERRRLVGVYGCPGKGKTTLTFKVAKQVAPQFQRVFWQSLRTPLPLEELLPTWLTFLSQDDTFSIPTSFSKQLDCLVQLLSEWRSLLVLDNFDSLFTPKETAAVFLPEYEKYGQLLRRLAEVEHQSCLLLTSREKLLGISTLEGNSSPVRGLKLGGFGTEVGALVLKEKNLCCEQPGVQTLIEQYDGNPTLLRMVSETIKNIFGGNIAAFLAQENALFPELKDSLNFLFQRLSEPEKIVIHWLANQDHSLTFLEVKTHIVPSLKPCLLQTVLISLEQRSLLKNIAAEGEEPRFHLPSMIREYLLESAPLSLPSTLPEGAEIYLGKWEYDIATQKVSWSPELFDILDWDINKGEPSYEQMLQLHVPEDQIKLQQVVDRLLQVGESYCVTLRHICPDGSMRYVESLGHMEKDEEGQPKRLYGVTQDITYRQLSENEHTPLVQPVVNSLILPEQVVSSQASPTTTYHLLGNSTNSSPILQPNNQTQGLKIIRPDLAQAYQNLNAYYEDIPFGYYSLDADGKFVYVNKVALGLLGGYEREELIGKSMGDILDEEYRLCFQINFPLFKERGWITDKEITGQDKSGRIIPLVMSAKVLRDESNQFLMTRTYIVDEKHRDRLAASVNISIP